MSRLNGAKRDRSIREPSSSPIANSATLGAAYGLSMDAKVRSANRWREQYNPLRGLTMARAVTLTEGYPRGEMADLQWTYYFIEQTDPDLFALVERRTSAICALDWSVKQTTEHRRTRSWDQSLADEQQAALREAYDRIDNLYEWLEHAAMASFRGFAHAEKHHSADGTVTHLEILDQWNVVRDGRRGVWKYNPSAQNTTYQRIPQDQIIDPAAWVIRAADRHINRIALFKFIRQNLSQKDWDGFIEVYGIPGIIIIGPPNVPAGKETDYETAAKATADGGSGYLPNGSTVHSSDGQRGVNPFRDHLRFLQEQLILAGTGGLLTMLTQSGSGTLAGGAHQDTFDIIARAEGRKISETAQKQLDAEILTKSFPGRPRLAYWELAGEQQEDPKQVADLAWKLKRAGLRPSPDQVGEKVGFELTEIPIDQMSGAQPPGIVPNRKPADAKPSSAALLIKATERFAKSVSDDLQPLRRRLERILQIEDPEVLRNRLIELRAELPAILRDINADPSSAKVIEDTLAAALLNGMAAQATQTPIKNNCGTGDNASAP